MGKPPHDPVGENIGAGPLQETEAGCGGGTTHSDDTASAQLQL